MSDGITLGALVMRALGRYPDRDAFAWDGGTLTYSGAAERIARFQAALLARGISRGDRLALLSDNTAESWCLNIAALALGIGTTWVHPKASLDDALFQIHDSGARAVAVDAQGYAERGRAFREKSEADVLSLGASDYGVDVLAEAERVGTQTAIVLAQPDDVATIHYTGGTTGRSKGAMRRQRAAAAFNGYACLADYSFPTTPRYFAIAPNSHAGGSFVTPTWMQGGCVLLERGFDPDAVLDRIERTRANCTFVVPTMIYALIDAQKRRKRDMSAFELLCYGAAPMSPTRIVEGIDVFGPVFQQIYGQTEYYPATVLRRGDHDPKRPERFGSCGFPITTTELVLLDESGEPVKRGEPGEICLRGLGAMNEYWNQPELTAETMAGGWVHTGDIARFDEHGYVYIVDRKKDMIISGGFNVYPRDVEDALATHAAVALAAVIGTPDERWGEAVTAFVVLRKDAKPTPEELIQHVRDRKGPIQAPKRVEFVSQLPLTAIGKIDKKALRAKFWGGQTRQVH